MKKMSKIGFKKGDTYFLGFIFYDRNGKANPSLLKKPIVIKKGDKNFNLGIDEEEKD